MLLSNPFRASVEPEFRVLIVCMGNICRSPMAEAVLRQKLERAGLERRVAVESAGTHGWRGSPVDERAAASGERRGYDLSRIRSRRVLETDFERFDMLLAMDADNMEHLLERCPQGLRDRISLLLDLAPRPDHVREIPDPYYGAMNGFEVVLDLLEPACETLVKLVSKRLDAPG